MEESLNGTAEIRNTASEFLLEYYLIKDNENRYGFKIEKKERKSGDLVLRERYNSQYVIDDKDSASDILDILTKNVVTPVTADSVLEDLGYL